METSKPIIQRYHHIWVGPGKSGKTATAVRLKKALEKVGVTLYHLDLDLARGVDHYPNAKNIKLVDLAGVYKFMQAANNMAATGQLNNAVLLIDPLNPIFNWIVESTMLAFGSDNFIADKRIKMTGQGPEMNALTAFYAQAKGIIADLEKMFPFIISVIHLKRDLISKGPKDEGILLRDQLDLYGQMRNWMHYKTDGSIMFGSNMDIEGNFTTTINKADPTIMNSLGMRNDPDLHKVANSDQLIDYYVDWLPKQFEYLKSEREKLNKEK